MQELHENEQYFFDSETVARLAGFARQFVNPCCLCAPTLGRELERLGVNACTLDVDERFADLRGFRRFDINRPEMDRRAVRSHRF